MRIDAREVPKRLDIVVDKTISDLGVNGVMKFGDENNYPQLMEAIILSSTTAKATAGIYAKFLTGLGFSDEVNKQIVGVDQFGADVSVIGLLSEICIDESKFHGAYIHCSLNREFKIGKVKRIPFKTGRLAKVDGKGYAAKMCVWSNWDNDKNIKSKKSDISNYYIFNSNQSVFNAQLATVGGDINRYSGQVMPIFLDDSYLYPLSPFDSVYLDADSEAQLALFRNRQLRDGMSKKTIFRVPPSPKVDENGQYVMDLETGKQVYSLDSNVVNEIHKFMGPDGAKCIVIEDDTALDADGNVSKERSFIAEQLDSNIQDQVFNSLPPELANNIRKAANALPRLLIEFEQGTVGPASGEAVKQAVSFYNALTTQQRDKIGRAFGSIFARSTNPVLAENKDWTIRELTLTPNIPENATTIVSTAATN